MEVIKGIHRSLHDLYTSEVYEKKVTIQTLPLLKCIRLVSARSSHLPLKICFLGVQGSLALI